MALQRAGAVTIGQSPNRENVIAQLIPCIRQVSGKVKKCGEERAGAVATGKSPNRENVIA